MSRRAAGRARVVIMDTRIERDSMGEMEVPAGALYGASTQRAALNFPISGHRLPAPFIAAMARIKGHAAAVNAELGLLGRDRAVRIAAAAAEVAADLHSAQFPLDVFQTGSATSSHTNVNEVIAHLANRGVEEEDRRVHPNDHVNRGQSSNDVVPSALHLSVALELRDTLGPALAHLAAALEAKAAAWEGVIKIGRTHLMDATPVTMGQVFSGYAAQVRKAEQRVGRAVAVLAELALGGTAVGTGLNSHPEFAARVCARLVADTGLDLRRAANPFEAQAARDDVVEVAGQLMAVAAALSKVANDIRWLGSGPRAGLAELRLPTTQPGSSIMPGKVNPVMSEMLVQVCLYVQAQAQMVVAAGREGHFELNATLPLMAFGLHEALRTLASGAQVFADRCVAGLEVDRERCADLVRRSLMLVTALNPHLGYDRAAEVAKIAFAEGRTLREVVLEKGYLDAPTLDRVLDPASMLGPTSASPMG